VAYEQGNDLSVSSLCYASGVPATTALRHIQRLEEHGLIEREGDRLDNRRLFVRPTEKAILGLEDAVAMLMDHVAKFDEPNDEAA
jgi:DNA-binding MarR family transcriptional regulator